MTDLEFLQILCCPETRQPLRVADADLLRRLNEQIGSGQLRNRAGQPVTRKCDAGLVRQDGRFFYPVCQQIPDPDPAHPRGHPPRRRRQRLVSRRLA